MTYKTIPVPTKKIKQETPPLRILIVDDNQDAALIFKRGFELLTDYEIIIAGDSRQALRYFQQQPFDLLIADYRLPEMDGLTLTMWIQELFPQTPAILISGLGKVPVEKFGEDVSLHTVLCKPVTFTKLCQVASDALRNGIKLPTLIN